MIRRAAMVALVAAAWTALLGAGAAPTEAYACSASTALGDRPHELDFHVRCSFKMTNVHVTPAKPAIVRAVREDVQLRHPDPEDRFRCWRSGRKAKCSGEAGSGVTISGALRMHGRRCETATRFVIQGGEDCDNPDLGCNAIGYAGRLRDPSPSGCGR